MLKNFLMTLSISFLLWSSFSVSTPSYAAESIQLMVNNHIISNNSQAIQPINYNNRVYVPLRMVAESLGKNVDWDASSRSVLIDSQSPISASTNMTGQSISIFINNSLIEVNDYIGRPFITPTGYTMVPIRVVAENLGANVSWDGNTQTVVIETKALNEGSSYNESHLPDSASKVTLMGESYASLEQMRRYISNRESYIKNQAQKTGKTFVPFPENIADLYYTIGKKYHIRGDVAMAQALLETGSFQFGNEVLPFQNNYCGLGAIGRRTTQEDFDKQVFSKVNHEKAFLVVGYNGWFFDTPASGVEAHIQHLYSYATAAALPYGTELLDGRFAHGNRGKATYLTDLNGKWAVPGNNYGENIYSSFLTSIITS